MLEASIPREIVSVIIDVGYEHRELDRRFEEFENLEDRVRYVLRHDLGLLPDHFSLDKFKKQYRYTLGSSKFSSMGIKHEFMIFCVAYSGDFFDIFNIFINECKSTFSDYRRYAKSNYSLGISSDLHGISSELACIYDNLNQTTDTDLIAVSGIQCDILDYQLIERLVDNSPKETILFELYDFVCYEHIYSKYCVDVSWYNPIIQYTIDTLESEGYNYLLEVKEFISAKYSIDPELLGI